VTVSPAWRRGQQSAVSLKIDKSVYIGLAFGAGVRLVFIYTAIAWPALPLTR